MGVLIDMPFYPVCQISMVIYILSSPEICEIECVMLYIVKSRVFNSGRGKKSEPTDTTDISGISGFFIFIFIFLFFFLFFYLLFSIKNIHKINFG